VLLVPDYGFGNNTSAFFKCSSDLNKPFHNAPPTRTSVWLYYRTSVLICQAVIFLLIAHKHSILITSV
jgi:hypothetical protein